MLTEAERARRVARSDHIGLALYALTLLGELPCAVVRGALTAIVVSALVFVGDQHGLSSTTPVALAAGLGPLLWSLAAFVYPLGTGWWWRTTAGARRPSARERTEYDRALAGLQARDASIRHPRHLYVLDDASPNAAVTADALMLNRGLVDSGWLEVLLAHELGHLNTLDGVLTAALNRLVIKPNSTEPVALSDRPLGLLILFARGGSGLLLTRPLWGAWDRSREYLADQYAAHLGQQQELTEFLETEVLAYDRPAPYGWMIQNSHPPTELRIEALTVDYPPGADEPLRLGRRAAAVVAAALAALALTITLLVSQSGSSGAGAIRAPSASAVAAGLGQLTPERFGIANLTNVTCQQTADPAKFDCSWQNAGQRPGRGRWEVYHGDLARISEGGDHGSPPASDAQASQIVGAVLRARGPSTQSASCRQVLVMTGGTQGPETQPPHEYTCQELDNGRSTGIDPDTGDPIRALWRWNPDGSVARESADSIRVADETTR